MKTLCDITPDPDSDGDKIFILYYSLYPISESFLFYTKSMNKCRQQHHSHKTCTYKTGGNNHDSLF